MIITRPVLISVLLIFQGLSFSQTLLPPPDSLSVSQQCDEIYLAWQSPEQSTYEIIGYNVYLEDSLLILTTDTTFQTQMQGYGTVVFNVTALYNEGESLPASIDVELVIYAPATNLIYNKFECGFSWSPPMGNIPNSYNWETEILEWCEENNGNSIGTGDEVEFEVAALWSPYHLSQISSGDLYVTEIEFFPAEVSASYIVKIWESQNHETPDELVYSQPVTIFENEHWNSIVLNDSILVDKEKYLWVGYQVNTSTGYPAGVDDGPAYDGYGNMMNFGGWQTLLEINSELNYNWNIRAICLSEESNLYYDIYGFWGCSEWDNWVQLNEYPVTDTTFWYACINPKEEWYPNNCFVQVKYCNLPVNSDTIDCEICWYSNSDPVSTTDKDLFLISCIPDNWKIHSDETILKIIVYDLTGKIIYLYQNEFHDLSINHQFLAPGLYILEGITQQDKFVRKIIK